MLLCCFLLLDATPIGHGVKRQSRHDGCIADMDVHRVSDLAVRLALDVCDSDSTFAPALRANLNRFRLSLFGVIGHWAFSFPYQKTRLYARS